jgi:hypothetical protein
MPIKPEPINAAPEPGPFYPDKQEVRVGDIIQTWLRDEYSHPYKEVVGVVVAIESWRIRIGHVGFKDLDFASGDKLSVGVKVYAATSYVAISDSEKIKSIAPLT